MQLKQILLMGILITVSFFVMYNKSQYKIIEYKTIFTEKGEQYSDKTSITRDEWGKPYIQCNTDIDCVFSIAYAACEDNFKSIQEIYATSKGILAQTTDSSLAGSDFLVHWMGIKELTKENYNTLSEKDKLIYEAYADGINYYASLHEDNLLHNKLYPITGQDVVINYLHTIQTFVNLKSLLKILHNNQLFSVPISYRSIQPLSKSDYKNENNQNMTKFDISSSTAFAISQQLSFDNETTYLTINPFENHDSLSKYYEVHINSEEGWKFSGYTMLGIPIPIMGHNNNLGWAHTINHPDLIDVFHLKINPDNENQYLFNGKWIDFVSRDVFIQSTKFGFVPWVFKKEILSSVYGPTIKTDSGFISVRFSGFHEQSLQFANQYLAMNKASSLEEWEKANKIMSMPLFNSIYADNNDNILYHYGGRIPIRDSHYNWKYIIHGESSETLWMDYVDYYDLPRLLNPECGFIQNCNSSPFNVSLSNNPNPNKFSPTLGLEEYINNKGLRLLELIKDNITFADIISLKYDYTYSNKSLIVTWKDILISKSMNAMNNKEEWTIDIPLLEAIEILKNWDHTASKENEYASLPILTFYPFLSIDIRDTNEDWVDNNFHLVIDRFVTVIRQLKYIYSRLDVEWGTINRIIDTNAYIDEPIDGAPDLLFDTHGIPWEDRLVKNSGDGLFMFVQFKKDYNAISETIDSFDTQHNQHQFLQNKSTKSSTIKQETEPNISINTNTIEF